jgi:hypothetical protein
MGPDEGADVREEVMTKPLPEVLLRCPGCKKDVPSKLIRLDRKTEHGHIEWAHRVPVEHGCPVSLSTP